MRIEPEISGVNLVLRGTFNPAIFTPAWFALHSLLPKDAAETATLEVAHQHLTIFSFHWFNLEVRTDRFSMETGEAPFTRVLDIVVRIFKEQLYHTPLTTLGINRHAHFRVDSQAARDRIGYTLAPPDPWGPWRQDLGLDSQYGGMTSLRMSQLRPAGRPQGSQIHVTVEPSNRIRSGPGVYVGVNDHYAIDDGAGPEVRGQLMMFLENDFETSIRRSDSIIDHIMSLAAFRED